MVNKEKNMELHIIVPNEEYAEWVKCKQAMYNGLPAMAKMIRDFVGEGVEREMAKRKVLEALQESVKGLKKNVV